MDRLQAHQALAAAGGVVDGDDVRPRRRGARAVLGTRDRVLALDVRLDTLGGTIANAEPLRIGRRDEGLGFYGRIDEVRTNWPFLRDRRIDAYAPITRRLLDEP